MQPQNYPPPSCQAVTKAPGVTPQAAVNLIVDTTYFGRKWGVMVLYDAISKRALSVLEVRNETIERYRQEVAALQERGVVIQSIICDGKSGLLGSFPDIPVQMCQFHQIKIIGVMDKTGAKKRRSPYAVRLSGVESL